MGIQVKEYRGGENREGVREGEGSGGGGQDRRVIGEGNERTTHLFIPLLNSKSLSPLGMPNTLITVPCITHHNTPFFSTID